MTDHWRFSMPEGWYPGGCWSAMHTAPRRGAAGYLEKIVRLQSVVAHPTQQGCPQLLVPQSEPGMCCRGEALWLPLAQVCSCSRGCSHHCAAVPCSQPPAMLWLWCHHHIKAWQQHGRERQQMAAALCKGRGISKEQHELVLQHLIEADKQLGCCGGMPGTHQSEQGESSLEVQQ